MRPPASVPIAHSVRNADTSRGASNVLDVPSCRRGGPCARPPPVSPVNNPAVSRPTRKSIRLPPPIYKEPGRPFSITIGTSPREPVFADISFGLACVNLLRDIRDKHGLLVYAYCLMPDHVHLLAAMTSRESITGAIRAWKSLCYRERHRRGDSARFWQRCFYDHDIRDDEGLFDVATYVLENPVRAGLVKNFHDYPLCGSLEFDV